MDKLNGPEREIFAIQDARFQVARERNRRNRFTGSEIVKEQIPVLHEAVMNGDAKQAIGPVLCLAQTNEISFSHWTTTIQRSEYFSLLSKNTVSAIDIKTTINIAR